MEILLAIILGSAFGFALDIVGAANPQKIIKMLRLEDLTLMKIILFAIGFASVLLSIANFIGIFDLSHLDVKATNFGVVIGGVIFGIGFGLAGTCPGTCVAATGGKGVKKAISAILGGLIGAFVFSQSYGWFYNKGLFSIMNLGKLTLFNISNEYPSIFNVGFLGLFIVGLLLMAISLFLPHNQEKEIDR